MERDEVKRQQNEIEEVEDEEEEATLQLRKSNTKNNDEKNDTELSNVHSAETNSHNVILTNGAENEESRANADEQEPENNNDLIENEQEKTGHLVYYDEAEGIWKCRICCWNYGSGSVCVDHNQKQKRHLHKLMSESLVQEKPIFSFETEGLNHGEEQVEKDSEHEESKLPMKNFAVDNSLNSTETNRYERDGLEDDTLPIPNLTPSDILTQEGGTSYKSPKEIEEIDLINGDGVEITELDVERVLQKQTTHDLYCPNCNSCITRRVILRKRKRRVRVHDEEVKRNKLDATIPKSDASSVQASDQVHHSADIGLEDTLIPAQDVDDHEREPDIFRCLSCFSFFIPTGNGFKLFRCFGEKNTQEKVQDERVLSVKKNWLTSIFGYNKQDSLVDQGSSLQTGAGNSIAGTTPSSSLGNRSDQSILMQKARPQVGVSEGLLGATGASEEKKVEQHEVQTSNQVKDSKVTADQINHGSNLSVTSPTYTAQVINGASAEDATSFAQQGGLKLLISTTDAPVPLAKPEEAETTSETKQEGTAGFKGSDMGSKVKISGQIPHGHKQQNGSTLLTEPAVESGNADSKSQQNGGVHPNEASQHIKLQVHSGDFLQADSISSLKDPLIVQGKPVNIDKFFKDVVAEKGAGKEITITIDREPVETAPSQSPQDVTFQAETGVMHSATQNITADQERTDTRKAYELEIIKSIIYGGLAESITSLSVVSSAAGGSAATLNILALGLANLIGGLFIICHNLWELKNDRIEQVSNQVSEQGDRYKELLGRRQNFLLHATVAILSYLIFGLLPPVIYGFSFRKSDDKELKLLVVAVASLLCIFILSIGRAYVQRPPKAYVKTVITFIILGFMVSGVSYAAGMLIERLLEKLGVFESNLVANLLLPETTPNKSAWASY